MILIERRKVLLVYRKRWFARKVYLQDGFFTMYAQFLGEDCPQGWAQEKFFTVLNALDIDAEGHLSRMKKGTAYEVRRAEKDGLQFAEENNQQNFLKFYNHFATLKKLGRLSQAHLTSLKSHLLITKVLVEEQVGAYHVYVLDPEEARARLLYSAQLQAGLDRALLGRANRWLHFKDMLLLQERGFRVYDWGGITKPGTDPEREGITQFKLGFGGTIEEEYNLYSPLLAFLRKMLRKS